MRYFVNGNAVHSTVALEDCSGGCQRVYHRGDRLPIAYAPENVTYAVTPPPTKGNQPPPVQTFLIVSFFGLFGVAFLFAAAVNMRM